MVASGLHSFSADAELSHLPPTSESEKGEIQQALEAKLLLPNYKNKIIKFFYGKLYGC